MEKGKKVCYTEEKTDRGGVAMFGRKKLFQEKMEPRCAYCAKGAPLEEGRVLCPRKGVMAAGGHCGAFRYDPLRRVPPKPAVLDTSRLSEADFRLD